MSSLVAAVSPSSDPFRGLSSRFLQPSSSAPVPSGSLGSSFPFAGKPAFPAVASKTIDVPEIRTSVTTDRKKTNALVCYTRVTPLDSELAAGDTEGCVFVSSNERMCAGEGNCTRSLVAEIPVVNKMLAEDADAKLSAATHPLDGWRAVETLRHWSLDGVLLSHRNEANKSDVLNVGVQGPCSARNVFDPVAVFAADTCYVALVAEASYELNAEGIYERCYRFKYVPCTSRCLADPAAFRRSLASTSAKAPELTAEMTERVVGCWKLGRVLDASAVRLREQHTLTVDVRVEWVGWRHLRQLYAETNVGGRWLSLPGAPRDNSCVLFSWPTRVVKNGPLEEPTRPALTQAEQRFNKSAVQDEEKRCKSPPLPPRKKRKKEPDQEIDLFDPPDTPPTSPLREDELRTAAEAATRVLTDVVEERVVIDYLKNATHSPATKPVWFDELNKLCVVFAIGHSAVLYKIENNTQGADADMVDIVERATEIARKMAVVSRSVNPSTDAEDL